MFTSFVDNILRILSTSVNLFVEGYQRIFDSLSTRHSVIGVLHKNREVFKHMLLLDNPSKIPSQRR